MNMSSCIVHHQMRCVVITLPKRDGANEVEDKCYNKEVRRANLNMTRCNWFHPGVFLPVVIAVSLSMVRTSDGQNDTVLKFNGAYSIAFSTENLRRLLECMCKAKTYKCDHYYDLKTTNNKNYYVPKEEVKSEDKMLASEEDQNTFRCHPGVFTPIDAFVSCVRSSNSSVDCENEQLCETYFVNLDYEGCDSKCINIWWVAREVEITNVAEYPAFVAGSCEPSGSSSSAGNNDGNNGTANNDGNNGTANNDGKNVTANNDGGKNGTVNNDGKNDAANNDVNNGTVNNDGGKNGTVNNDGQNGTANNDGNNEGKNGTANNDGNNEGNYGTANNDGKNGTENNDGNNEGNYGTANNDGKNSTENNDGNNEGKNGTVNNDGKNSTANNDGNNESNNGTANNDGKNGTENNDGNNGTVNDDGGKNGTVNNNVNNDTANNDGNNGTDNNDGKSDDTDTTGLMVAAALGWLFFALLAGSVLAFLYCWKCRKTFVIHRKNQREQKKTKFVVSQNRSLPNTYGEDELTNQHSIGNVNKINGHGNGYTDYNDANDVYTVIDDEQTPGVKKGIAKTNNVKPGNKKVLPHSPYFTLEPDKIEGNSQTANKDTRNLLSTITGGDISQNKLSTETADAYSRLQTGRSAADPQMTKSAMLTYNRPSDTLSANDEGGIDPERPGHAGDAVNRSVDPYNLASAVYDERDESASCPQRTTGAIEG
ncbi:hypothetical protein PoB_003436800 [Plakobranchus ocellatus]|uniref:Uncharacterized protein n=1 Tax=Plakobranchus ocellatus TaxID=259542 RepID=A0AAV4AM45_9GAST|nr:hypothetical protein PoB_003436800 [Plakobranchus ocellatus]